MNKNKSESLTHEEINISEMADLIKKKSGTEHTLKKLEKEDVKIYLTEQEANNIQVFNKQIEIINKEKDNLAETETLIFTLKKQAKSLKKSVVKSKKEIELFESRVMNELTSKYGKFTLGENNEVLKAGN